MISAGTPTYSANAARGLALLRVRVNVQKRMLREHLAHGRVRAVRVLVRIELHDIPKVPP